jgi:predicted MPP superfamily phosphohydrolase
MSVFAVASWLAYAAIVALSYRTRGRTFATFMAVILGIFTAVALGMRPQLTMFEPLPVYLQAAVYVHFLSYQRPRLRGVVWRFLISIPASFYAAGTLLAWPWALCQAFGYTLPLGYAPYVFALIGVVESFFTAETVRDLVLDMADAGQLRRYPLGRVQQSGGEPARPLTMVQITDPHLGPFMSVSRLARICQRAVERNPHLIFLTGDLLTVESNREPDALLHALAPLAAARGRVYACLGNHDHEAPHVVRRALDAHGVRLLVDEAEVIDTTIGRVQILGIDFYFRGRKQLMAKVFEANPRPEGALRIVLLHDPGAFARVPHGEGDLVLSGHTHGGQVGLVTFGLPWTLVSLVTKLPDHGFWARGKDRLYVHRGTGHYGFPLRVGVPAEQSLIRIHVAENSS